MTRDRQSRWPSRLRAALAGLAVAAALAFLLSQAANTARGAALAAGGVAAFRTKDGLRVAVTLTAPAGGRLRGTLRVELLNRDGRSLGAREKEVDQAVRSEAHALDFPAAGLKPVGIILRCTFGSERHDVDLAKVLVVRAHETSLSAGQEFHAGSRAALRCGVHAVKSFTDTVPLAGAGVTVTLRAKDGKAHELYRGLTGDDGAAHAEFRVPELPAGTYTLEVATRSALGEETLKRDVRVRSEVKVLLVNDKPLYQPGQTIHLRALCLRPFDLSPVAGADLVFEVEDPKGNKVFKRSHKTSDFGVAAADFQLADEVNNGPYQIRALVGDQQTHKTVEVKRYVLPKFKVEVKADKTYYLPKETVRVDLQADYFFGKPVAGGKVKVTASTFDVQFRDFQTAEVTTDAAGHARVEVKLPDYFVGQPLQKGDALVKVEVKLTDAADHAETVTRTYPVSDRAIRVSLIPEGGRLIPGVENRLFAAALYPDGSPAAGCEVRFWKGTKGEGKPHTAVRTNDAGLAEFRLTPKPEEFRRGEWGQRSVETLGGTITQAAPRRLFDLTAEAKDAKGNNARTTAALDGEPFGDNVLLRLDKAIYRAGDALTLEVLTSAGLPTAYLDVIKGGQTVLTRWLDVKDGKASYTLDLPPGLFGTLEVHAYQMLTSGEIVRDGRVVYVHSRDDLKIEAKADRDVYLPGQPGKVVFQVTDAAGKPTAAALGVIVVDEAVYALQEMQPGLEKVYFTLQEELLKPRAQAAPVATAFRPNTTVEALVRQGEIPAEKQQIAAALLTAARPKTPARWNVDPVHDRRKRLEATLQQIGSAFYWHTFRGGEVIVYDREARAWAFKPGLLGDLTRAGWINRETLKDPFAESLTLEGLAKWDKNLTPDGVAKGLTLQRIQVLASSLVWYTDQNPKKWQKGDMWVLPPSVLSEAAGQWGYQSHWLKDAWGNSLRLERRDRPTNHDTGHRQFDRHEIVSAGPDGKFGTGDDVTSSAKGLLAMSPVGPWFGDRFGQAGAWGRRDFFFGMPAAGMGGPGLGMPGTMGGMPAPGMGGGGGFGGDRPAPMAAMRDGAAFAPVTATAGVATGKGDGGGAPLVRLREFFPETMLWRPALVTDDRGRAELPLTFADSITTWRLSASASSQGGALGGLTLPLRVFQDFFVDIDLPVSLTQNDEVSFPVAVYNYLKTPQTLRLELREEPWFRLVEGGFVRTLDLKPNEVTSVKFRVKAAKIGVHPLTVTAAGSTMSDAVKRTVEVVPDGRKVEQVVADRLSGKVKQTLTIPDNAVPDASKLVVKLYPGVFSQVLEGVDGLLRLPGG